MAKVEPLNQLGRTAANAPIDVGEIDTYVKKNGKPPEQQVIPQEFPQYQAELDNFNAQLAQMQSSFDTKIASLSKTHKAELQAIQQGVIDERNKSELVAASRAKRVTDTTALPSRIGNGDNIPLLGSSPGGKTLLGA